MKKRIAFADGKQEEFFKNIKLKTALTWKKLSDKLMVKESTLSKAYRFGLCNLPYDIFKRILEIIEEDELTILKNYGASIVDEKLVIGRKVFGERKKQLNDMKIIYSNNNLNLDISKVNFSNYDKEKGIKLPNKLTSELAEEIGIHYGDGFLSEKRYDYRLKGNPYNEREYYLNYIAPLFKKLYNIDVSLKDFKASYGFELRSKAIWEFKTKILGIKPGKKYTITFPDKLKVNDVNILTAFIRGLFDTDGSISFKSKYGYKQYYPSIEISLTSKKVIKDVAEILFMMGFKPWVGFNEKYGRISIYGISQFKKYEELIGWSSPKNLNKVNDWKKRYPKLNLDMANVVQRLRRTTVAREKGVRLSPFALSTRIEQRRIK